MIVPGAIDNNNPYVNIPLEPAKAWAEMVHRYVAGTLGLFIFALMVFAYFKPSLKPFRALTTALSALVVFQAALGMWTVTLLLHPTIVMAHLLGGMTIISLLWLLYLRTQNITIELQKSCCLTAGLLLALVIVALQIALGGWVSANYAAMACTDFPTCREVWLPELHWREAFGLLPPLDQNYEGGFLAHPARVTIHFLHRVGGLLVLLYLGSLSVYLMLKQPVLRAAAAVTFILLIVQVLLGVSNIVMALPLSVATAHNGVAALLLLAVVSLNYLHYRGEVRS
jgi:cytochrome c oxidase assembly protein subunit 15